jgi:hypothetical protein
MFAQSKLGQKLGNCHNYWLIQKVHVVHKQLIYTPLGLGHGERGR